MWDYKKNLHDNKISQTRAGEMARKLFLSYPTYAFADEHEVEFSIRDRVRKIYRIPLSSVQVTGSAKAGFSLVKKTTFEKGVSDLDLAIIDHSMFARLWEAAHEASNGFDATKFQDLRGAGEESIIGSGKRKFLDYLQRGIISPELLPSGRLRADIIGNFERVTQDYRHFFSKISAFFYSSEYFFQAKQESAIEQHWEGL